jgi:hypothetical protein
VTCGVVIREFFTTFSDARPGSFTSPFRFPLRTATIRECRSRAEERTFVLGMRRLPIADCPLPIAGHKSRNGRGLWRVSSI